ncbi:RHS repeat-associated core domain-containing protein [Pseudomonas chlororaphis]|uniref:RHS repeat-associated core domain-containing protein n=1 Tax=Pseudomonas chlororaphis TaxID=587753 RepID=UPI0015DDDB1A|nr:RHS repeat protein [Pseudomonas chlororaphis]QLL11846.1 RHS repeat protein [Pseudomonas chlororaphis subsp. aurantiaca]
MTTITDVATAQRCLGTPTLSVVDNRGLLVRTVQYNRTTAEEPLDELISQQTYSVLGHLSSSIDPRLLAEQQLDSSVPPNIRYVSSLSGQQLKLQSQDAGERLALYDSEGGVVWQQDARVQQLTRTFDPLHRLTSIIELAEGTRRVSERLIYADSSTSTDANLCGQLLQAYSPAGMALTDAYSITGQLLRSEQQFLQDEILHSDWAGSDPSVWNAALTPETFTARWAYDALAQAVQTLDAKGNQQHCRFNIAGQLATSELLLAGQTTPKAVLQAIDYSAAGQVLHEEAGNGVVTDYVYELQTQRLSSLTTIRPAQRGRATVLQALTYQYDPVGNLLAINNAAKAIRYTRNQQVAPLSRYQYDALYQLCQAGGRENANAGQQTQALPLAIVPLWQEMGELTNYTRTYTYDRGNNLTAIQHVGLHPYTQQMVVATTSNRAVQQTVGLTPQDVDGFFDACGNLLQLTPGQPLSWDSRNQLLRTTQVVRNGSDDDCEVYWYDSQGQRATKLGMALTSGTTQAKRVRYLPGLELRQTEQTPSEGGSTSVTETLQVIQFAAAGRQALRVLHWEQGKPVEIENDQCRYSLGDQIGSSLLELDQQADILTREEYFPFGGTAVWSARNETETRYKYVRYSGKERDATGLYYYGFRYYAPWLGRWLNPDPAGTVDGLNLFCMAGNNPITRKDITGLMFRSNNEKNTPTSSGKGFFAAKFSNWINDSKAPTANPASKSNSIESASTNKTIAVNRFNQFLELLQLQKPPSASASTATPVASELHRFSAKNFGDYEYSPTLKQHGAVKLLSNKADGNCLLYALAGRDLSFEEIIELREDIAKQVGISRAGRDVSSLEIYSSLVPTIPNTLALIEGLDKVSVETLQAMIKVPGIYAGDTEIHGYTKIPGNPKSFVVMTEEENKNLEIRMFSNNTTCTLYNGLKAEATSTINEIRRQELPMVYLTGSGPGAHWQRAF